MGGFESTQEARVALGCASINSYICLPLSYTPNFPRAQYVDLRTLTHEVIVNCTDYTIRRDNGWHPSGLKGGRIQVIGVNFSGNFN